MFSVARFEFENQQQNENENENESNNYLSKVENKIKKLKKKKKENNKNNKKEVKTIINKVEEVKEISNNNSDLKLEKEIRNDKEKKNIRDEGNKNNAKKRKIEIEKNNELTKNENDGNDIKMQYHIDKKKKHEINDNSNNSNNNNYNNNRINIREDKKKQKKEKSLLGLPEWLAKPILISPYIEKNEENDINNSKFYLSKTVISCLNQMKITHLFPVQTSVLPFLLSTPTSTRMTGDLCVSAPTGSGKTLAYVLPIVETLSKRIIQRLRALIILPTRDLVAQVKETFNIFTQKTNLKVIAITGSISFTNEQSQLIDEKTGNCKVDIVIATPGRLIDHLNGTPGFTLSHLRYLIIDEADRLLNQHYQDWLNQVLNCINSVSNKNDSNSQSSNTSIFKKGFNDFNISKFGLPEHSAKTFRKNNANLVTDVNYDYLSNENKINHCTPIQKLLFSATLTRNPAKIASLQLYNPTYISVSTIVTNPNTKTNEDGINVNEETSLVDSHYVIPPELHESMMVCKDSGQKPLALFHLLFNIKVKNALCFTNSLESAHRLGRLIHIFNNLWEKKIKEKEEGSDNENEMDEDNEESEFHSVTTAVISSEMPLATRRKILHSSTLPTIIICSDIMARGLDLSNDLSFDYVINYEIPNRPKTYVHRVGRTARAGKEGQAISIVEAREAKWFKDMMSRIDREENKKVKKNNFKDKDISPFYEVYNESLKELKEEVYQKKFNKDNKKSDKNTKKQQKEEEKEKQSSSDSESSSSSSSSSSDSDDESSSDSSSESDSSDNSSDNSSSESEDESSDNESESD